MSSRPSSPSHELQSLNRELAGLLLVPYLVWVTFAVVLNWTIWRMNA